MPEILTSEYKTDACRRFAQDVQNNNYYVMVSSIEEFEPDDTQVAKNAFLEKVIFGKKIKPEDTHFMIKYYPWQRDQVFVQYDDNEPLDEQRFYCVVGPNDNDTGDYRVYKCLFNNYGAGVQSPPAYNDSSDDQIYRTADGYIWKFMYVVSALEEDAYSHIGYIPLVGDFNLDPPASPDGGGGISDILVENNEQNFGYVEEQGRVTASDIVNSVVEIVPSTTFNPRQNYYNGQSIYFNNPDGSTYLYRITGYVYDDTSNKADITLDQDPVVQGGGTSVVKEAATFSIFPTVKIEGDGSGAVAIPNIVGNAIDTVIVLNPGTGYNNAVATVVDPENDFNPDATNSTDVRAQVRAILTPDGDHGYNLIDEFKCRHYSLYGYITGDDNNQIGATNTYGCVGIVKNPEFSTVSPPIVFDNRIGIVSDNIDRITLNDSVVQLDSDNEIQFSGIIHEVDTENETFYIAEYMGPYVNGTDGNSDTSLNFNLPIRNSTGQTIEINTPEADNVTFSPYVQRSGKIYFMENFKPLPRTEGSREEFKFVLEF